MLDLIPVEEPGTQDAMCVQATRYVCVSMHCMKLLDFILVFSRPEDYSRKFLRVECSIRNYPPISNTLELAEGIFINNSGFNINLAVCKNSIVVSGSYTGFYRYISNKMLSTTLKEYTLFYQYRYWVL